MSASCIHHTQVSWTHVHLVASHLLPWLFLVFQDIFCMDISLQLAWKTKSPYMSSVLLDTMIVQNFLLPSSTIRGNISPSFRQKKNYKHLTSNVSNHLSFNVYKTMPYTNNQIFFFFFFFNNLHKKLISLSSSTLYLFHGNLQEKGFFSLSLK